MQTKIDIADAIGFDLGEFVFAVFLAFFSFFGKLLLLQLAFFFGQLASSDGTADFDIEFLGVAE